MTGSQAAQGAQELRATKTECLQWMLQDGMGRLGARIIQGELRRRQGGAAAEIGRELRAELAKPA